jgi:lipoyl(octanoyl) transferase
MEQAAPIGARWLGRIGYREAWALQKGLVAQRAAGEIGDVVLLIEHGAVLTLGHVSSPAAGSRSSGSNGAAR